MRKCPSLKFIANPDKDFKIYKDFIQSARCFDLKKNLEIGFYKPHPKIKTITKSIKNQREKDKLIKDYIKKIYQRDSSQIYNNGICEAKRKWQAIKTSFFKETSKIFKQHHWLKAKYIAYVTIWGVYPRLLYNKIFFFPYKYENKSFISLVIMHEMLHFLFYDYAIRRHPKIFKRLETETGIFWDLSEIFNVIILSLPEFKKLHKANIKYYPKHKKYLIKLKKLWEKTKDIDLWLVEGYGYIKNQSQKNKSELCVSHNPCSGDVGGLGSRISELGSFFWFQ